MDEPVVEGADVGGFVEIGWSAVFPEGEVVELAAGELCLAFGEHAALVAERGGAALGAAEDPAGPAEVEDLSLGAEDGGDEVRLTREPPGGGGGDRCPVEGGVPELAGLQTVAELGERDRDDDLWALATVVGELGRGVGRTGRVRSARRRGAARGDAHRSARRGPSAG